MLERHRRKAAHRRRARHREHELRWLFTLLPGPGLDATNHAAESAIRGRVIARKVWGGNQTWKGAHPQQVLASVLRTGGQQGKDAVAGTGSTPLPAQRSKTSMFIRWRATRGSR
jgi:hypothetical protein